MKVRFPTVLPFFFSGLKVAVTLSVIGAVVGEFVGSDRGLGYAVVIDFGKERWVMSASQRARLG